jgi:hypothetical protein
LTCKVTPLVSNSSALICRVHIYPGPERTALIARVTVLKTGTSNLPMRVTVPTPSSYKLLYSMASPSLCAIKSEAVEEVILYSYVNAILNVSSVW